MPKKNKSDLGKSLMKKPAAHTVNRPADVYVQEWAGPSKSEQSLNSALDLNDLSTIAEHADLAQTRFVAEKQHTVVLQTTSVVLPSAVDEVALSEQRKNWNNLTIPRRPIWTPDMTTEQLHDEERKAFLNWRSKLALVEANEHLLLSPYEKNIAVWMQLWRVIDRSDLIVQILDSRDPLLFRSPDLEKYVDEFAEHKLNVLMMNKADLLSEPQRKYWADYFRNAGIRVIFFSARAEQIKLEEEAAKEEETLMSEMEKRLHLPRLESDGAEGPEEDDEDEDGESGEETEEAPSRRGVYDEQRLKQLLGTDENDEMDDLARLVANRGAPKVQKRRKVEKIKFEEPEVEEPVMDEQEHIREVPKSSHQIQHIDTSLASVSEKIFTRTELFDYLYSLAKSELGPKEKVTVGMVGYPNVGKSSTVNVLVEKKRVAVSSTPGKTKHFQTIQIHDNITLLDCPGLVFPTFMSSKAEMHCNGLMRIAEIKECLAPTSIVARLVPRREFEYMYGISLPKIVDPTSIVTTPDGKVYAPKAKLTPQQLLDTYATHRGFHLFGGKPDRMRAARIILSDFVDGKLLFCRAPPVMEQKEFSKLTKFHNEALRVVNEDAPIQPRTSDAPDAHNVRTAPFEDEGDEPEELTQDDLVNLADPAEIARLTGREEAKKAKVKHARINKRQEKRQKKRAVPASFSEDSGVRIGFKPATTNHVRSLPTHVKLAPGSRPSDADPNSTAKGRTFVASVKK